MMSENDPLEEETLKEKIDPTQIKPYGDTMNDGKVQLSFTLPVEKGAKGIAAAKILVKKMGLHNPSVVYNEELDDGFTFFIVYGTLVHSLDLTKIGIESMKIEELSKDEINSIIKEDFGRKIVIVGATTGTDAHTVGIDAVMNMKGYAGHKGLESFEMIETYNFGSQVPNEEFVKRAIELNADVLLVSQVVTQKNIHITNLTNLVELLEAEGLRKDVILICGGPRINNQLAKELGYDAGFGPGTYASQVASFIIKEIKNRNLI
ncbi:MAG: Lysine 5,6-aminomutase beta subunit [Promethearchaeota archaeon]|nr:MAG: Lysine 5,6-aminomutase beta subunit [Candidatus Lokiarchaeota archaeon]